MQHKNSRRRSHRPAESHPALIQPLEGRQLMSVTGPVAERLLTVTPAAVNGTVVGFTPSQVRTAYGFTAPFVYGNTPADGRGQTIAVVDAYSDPTIAADLKVFDAQFGLANPSLTIVNQYGSASSLPPANGSWAQEISLDVEWAHAIAPGANILLVETTSATINDLVAGVNYARGVRGVSAVSMSWGVNEYSGETALDGNFTTPSGHDGVAFVGAAGDTGTASGPLFPAASPHVLSVGGTTLTTTGSYAYSSETTWASTGGGVSKYEAEPAYQRNAQTTGYRTVPDVAYDANPSTGFAVYDSDSYNNQSGWLKIGGTSAAVPQWAALIAIADQGHTLYGGQNLQGDATVLPTLYATYKTSSYASTFHDVTTGTSGSLSAKSGYDYVTGLGSPYARGVATALVNAKIFQPLPASTAHSATAAAIAAPSAVVADPAAAPIADAEWAAPAAAVSAAAVAATPALAAVPSVAAMLSAAAPAIGGVTYAPYVVPATAVVAAPFVAGSDVAAGGSVSPLLTVAGPVLPTSTLAAPLASTTFTLTLPATGAAPSFATVLAASTRALHPLATGVAIGAAVALWLATEPARDAGRKAALADLFGDRLIGLVPARA